VNPKSVVGWKMPDKAIAGEGNGDVNLGALRGNQILKAAKPGGGKSGRHKPDRCRR